MSVASVDLQDETGCSPLYAACHEGHADVARALLSLKAPARADLRDKRGRTPLFAAAHEGHVDVVRAL